MTQDDDSYYEECVNLSVDDIKAEFCRLPADLAYWGARHAEALEVWKTAKSYRESTEARLHLIQRETLAVGGSKRPTVADIAAAVTMAPEYSSAHAAEISAEAAHLAAKNRFLAVSAKKDILQSLGAHVRMEMSQDPIIRDFEL